MCVQWRRLRPGELDHELIWLLVTLATAGIVAGWFALHLPWPGCAFRALLGIPCMTCGSTRAAIAFAQGDFFVAWRFNPLAFAAICGLILFDIYAIAVLCARAPRLRMTLPNRTTRRFSLAMMIAFSAANWIYLLGH